MSPNRVALVTGGAVRIGQATVEMLASQGWAVAFTYRSSARAATALCSALERGGTSAAAFRADLADPRARRLLAQAVHERFGRLDALVNNAAVFPRTPISDLDEASYRRILATNLEAPLFLTLACAAMLRRNHGAVVNIADIYGIRPLRHFLPYSVSKAGLLAATQALAVELAPQVRVNAVAPGIAEFPADYPEETRKALISRTLLGRPGNAAEIARTVSFLLEPASTMTGQVVVVDGGRSAVW